MQSPTPPTKPIPPTPPSINPSSSTTNKTDTQTPQPTTPKTINSSNSTPGTSKTQPTPEKQPQNPVSKTPISEKPDSANTEQTPPLPYLSTSKDTSQKTTAPITPFTNNKPTPSIGFGFFLPFFLIIAVSFFVLRWWRNTTIKKRTLINYSTDTSKDLLNLMNSQASAESLPKPKSKLILKPKVKKEQKGNFEIRI